MSKSIRQSIILGCWMLMTLVGLASAQDNTAKSKAPARSRPNIVFIFTDDHAYQAMSCYGSRINQTPQLDRLARSGMRFDRCLVTNSICGPSRATILTGKYSHLNGFRQNGDRFDGSQVTMPKLLQAVGYQTALFGKWHLNSDPTGFDEWMVLPDQGDYYNPDFLTPNGKVRVDGYVTDVITERGIEWMAKERDSNKPFMLMLQHKAPHRNWMPGPKHLGDLRDVDLPEPETLFDDYATRADVLKENQMTIARHFNPPSDLKIWDPNLEDKQPKYLSRLKPEQRKAFTDAYAKENADYVSNPLEGDEKTRYFYQRYLKDYLRCIASVDDSVGQVLDYLDANGLSENTVVVYASDQGFYLGEHGWYDKRWIFEESLRTPLLVRWPGVTKPNTSCDRIVSNLDFAETLLEMAGAEVPAEMQGCSIAPLLRGESPADWRTSFYYHYYELHTHRVAAHYGVVTDRYKLVRYYERLNSENKPEAIDQWDLMDREKDPNELRSFIADPSYATTKATLQAELERLRKELKVGN
ncbi:MAG: sulfatase [Pirellulaceae bacterium]